MKFNLEQIKRKMLVKYPFFGGVIANIKYIETDSVKTAATDGINVYYNPFFFEKINKEEQTFILSHETCHIAFEHIRRSEGKDNELWNIATDAVINANLERDGLKIPEGGISIEGALDYDSEELYEKLKEERDALNQMSGQGEEGQQDQNEKQKGSSGSQGSSSQDEKGESQDQGENGESQDQDENSQSQSSSNSQKQDKKNKNKSQGSGQSDKDEEEEEEEKENSKGSSSKGDKEDEKDKNDQSSGGSSDQDEDNKDQDEKSGGSSSKNKEKDKQNKDDNSVNGDNDNEEKEQGVDNSHKLWEEGLKKLKEQEKEAKEKEEQEKAEQENEDNKDKGEDKNQNSKDKDENNQKDNRDNNQNDNRDNNQSRNKSEKEAFEENLEKRKQELQSLKEQLMEVSKKAGLTTNAQDRQVDTAGYSKPIVDWRYILREAISQNVDWSLKNGCIEDGVVTYKLETYPTPETEIVLDTSGSINETLLRNFLRECKNILHHSKVKVGCFDTQFYGFEEIRREKDIETLKFKGYGGTNFNAAVNAFTKRVENKIIFTDGYAPMPDKEINAIWLVYGEDEINPKGGKVIYITDDMLRELNQSKGKPKTLRR